MKKNQENIKIQIEKMIFEIQSRTDQILVELSLITNINVNKIKIFINTCYYMLEIFLLKNMAYKDSYKKHGILGMIIRISDKIDRIYNLEMKNLKDDFVFEDDEPKLDTFYDIANYCIMSIMELNERNK